MTSSSSTTTGLAQSAAQLDYWPLTGLQKWFRYAWYPLIDILCVVGSVAAIMSFRQEGISWVNLGILLFMFNLIGLGGEAGLHRLFAHRSYQTSQPVRIFLAIAGTMVGEAPILEYVAYHRCHHAFADQAGDLHSPYYVEGRGIINKLRNIWHAFMGWKYNDKTSNLAPPEKYAKDMLEDPAMVMINYSFYAIVLSSFALPAALGYALTGGSAHAAWTAFLWGGCFRFVVMTLMGDLIIRAGCHLFGTRPFIDPANSNSSNLWFLAVPSLGLAWHNNHHAFPDSAQLDLDWWQVDPSGSFIGLLEKLGLASALKRPTAEQIATRRAQPSA